MMSVQTLIVLCRFRDKLIKSGEEKIGNLLTEALVESEEMMKIANDKAKNWWRFW